MTLQRFIGANEKQTVSIFKVISTSNLLATNKCWQTLKEKFDLSFGEYGNVTSALFSGPDYGLIIVIFLEDLVQGITFEKTEIRESQTIFIESIKEKAKASTKPIIICFGSNLNQSVIEGVKGDTDLKKFHNWYVEQLNLLRDSFESIYFMNLGDTFYKYGAVNMFSQRNWYFGRCRLSIDGLEVITHKLALVIDRIKNSSKKVLVLDCDNTLWGGVIGEDGLGGLTLGQDGLGQAFIDFQKEIVRLSNKGVIIVLASKNNNEDVWKVFDNHDAMFLKREHIVATKVNWNEKADNLAQVASDLDLDADSFVFWDDNPLERDKMRTLMPEVLTVEVPKNVFEWPTILSSLDNFANFKVTTEDKTKTEQYRSRAEFSHDKRNVKDLKSFLFSLNLTPVSLSLSDTNIARAEQMCLKTNQFNLRTKRYTASELLNLHKENNDYVFLVRLSDVYGDHGIVALVCLRYLAEDIVFLDTFLMSCRVLGRHLEAWILDQIIKRALRNRNRYILTDFIDTGRNKIAREFLTTYGFECLENNKKVIPKILTACSELKGERYFIPTKNIEIPNLEIYKRSK